MSEKRQEKDYYEEIAKAAERLIRDNLASSDNYSIMYLLGEVSSALRSLLINGYYAGPFLREYSKTVHRLWLDLSILIENKSSGKFELIIFEVKIGPNLGLTELAQLIGYCLVSRCKFGILVNVDSGISSEFSKILQTEPLLTTIERIVEDGVLKHEMGIMIWNSETQNLDYTQMGAIKSIPDLVRRIERSLE